jgi:hypothetical protein
MTAARAEGAHECARCRRVRPIDALVMIGDQSDAAGAWRCAEGCARPNPGGRPPIGPAFPLRLPEDMREDLGRLRLGRESVAATARRLLAAAIADELAALRAELEGTFPRGEEASW